jgi:SAM-dependent methyltransferase
MGGAIPALIEERMDPNTLLHRFRYHLSRGYVTPKDTVLDLGCGTGYGTEILSKVAKFVTAYDINKQNLHTCNLKYKRKNNKFILADLETARLRKADVAVSFEVIEHFYEPARFIQKLKSKIRKFIIVSIPIGETLIIVDGKPEVKGDDTHHFVFPESTVLDMMFIDHQWERFFGFQSGVTYIVVYYNKDQYED